MKKIALILPILFFIYSCSSRIDMVNDDFIKQYGNDVNRINQEREAFEKVQKTPSAARSKKTYGWNDPAVIIGAAGTYKYKSAYIDTSQIKLKPKAEQSLPSMDTLNQNMNYRRLPENMFDIKYLAVNYPESYGSPPVSFDDISIPSRDAYGIGSGLGDKNYTLINGKDLQRSVDNINNTTADDDNEVRLILVKEQKEMDRKKRSNSLKSKEEKVDDEINENQKDDKYESKLQSTIN